MEFVICFQNCLFIIKYGFELILICILPELILGSFCNDFLHLNVKFNFSASPLPSPMRSPAKTPMAQQRPSGPCCSALYDFDPENPGELGFKVSDQITIDFLLTL